MTRQGGESYKTEQEGPGRGRARKPTAVPEEQEASRSGSGGAMHPPRQSPGTVRQEGIVMRGARRRPRDEHGKDPPRPPVLTRLLCFGASALLAFACWNICRIRAEEEEQEASAAYLQSFASLPPEPDAEGSAPPGKSAVPQPSRAPAQSPGRWPQQKTEAASFKPAAAASSGAAAGAAAVDFGAVLAEAPDTRAWIRIPGTNIHYPVVQADDNSFYLTHGPDGSYNRSGAIFISSENDPLFRDPNTVLYGHRMNCGTMFAALDSYRDRSFLVEHPDIFLTLPDGTALRYEIFCVQQIPDERGDAVYRTTFAGEDDFLAWQDRKRAGVLCARKTEPTEPDAKYLTLSTCVKGSASARLVVQARCIAAAQQRKENP